MSDDKSSKPSAGTAPSSTTTDGKDIPPESIPAKAVDKPVAGTTTTTSNGQDIPPESIPANAVDKPSAGTAPSSTTSGEK
jgi:hypothetical protein